MSNELIDVAKVESGNRIGGDTSSNDVAAVELGYRCEVVSVAAFLSQLVRLVSSGHYFYFACTLKQGKDPQLLDRKLIDQWDLDKPSWKREARRRGRAPNIHYLRYRDFYLLIATHGKSSDGTAHRFFREYEKSLNDIRRNSLEFSGYSIRSTVSKKTGKRQVFVRLGKETYSRVRAEQLVEAVRPQNAGRESFEGQFQSLPIYCYRPVREQLYSILKEVNRRRRYAGFPAARPTCIPKRVPVTKVFERFPKIPTSCG